MFSRRPITAQNRGRVPSGGQAADPLVIFGASLLQWVRSDLGITIATGVSAWADQSGNGNDYSQGTAGAQPAFNATGGPNSTPCVTFDGTDDVLVSAGFTRPAPGTEPTYVSAIVRQDTWVASDTLWSSASTSNIMIVQMVTASPILRQFNGIAANNNSGLAAATWGRIEAYYANTAGVDFLKCVATQINVGTAGNNSGTGRVLGATSAAAVTPAAVSFAEVVYANTLPSAAQRAALDAYYTARYGTGLV